MKKLYFLLCLVLCSTFLFSKTYSQSNSVTFDFSGGNTANGHKDIWSTKNDYKLKVTSNYNTLYVLGIGGPTMIGPAYNFEKLTTFSIDDQSPFDLNSIDVFNNSNNLTNIIIKTSKGGSATMQIGGNNYNVFRLPTNDDKFKQITSFTVEGSSELNQFQYDNVKLDNITDLIPPKPERVSSTSADKTYRAEEVISIQVYFSEKVTVTGTPKLELETGAVDRFANYVSGSGTSTLNFEYKVQDGDVTSRLNYTSESALFLNGGTIKDRGGNNPDPLPPPSWTQVTLAATKNIVIDALAPKVNLVTSGAQNGNYKVGDLITILVDFSEEVYISGTPQLELKIGNANRKIDYKRGSGGSRLEFDYTVHAGDFSSDLDYSSTASLTLNGGTILDLAGNVANLTLPAPGATNSLGANKNIVIFGVAPTVVSVNSITADGTYKLGDAIYVQVNFSENVNITGSPQINLETGAVDRVASYWSGTGTSTLVFRYTVQEGDSSADLDYVATTSFTLNGGTIKDAAANNAVLTLPTPRATNSLSANKNISVDGILPTIVSVNSLAVDKTYKSGDEIDIQVKFSENVNVTGTPQLTLETGATDQKVNYSSGSGTSTLIFKYTVQVGDASADLDYVATNSLSLNGGTIKDAAGNVATLTLPTPGAANSLAANKAIVIDGAPPTVVSVTCSNTSRTYRAGQSITIWVNFSDNVTVTGTPQLTLETGPTDRVINYVSGSGTQSLRFDYNIQFGDYTSDLDYVATNSLKLNGGTIKNARNDDFILTLPTPGAALSLSSSKNIVIEQVNPNADGVLFVNKQAGSFAENGNSWSTAVRELSNALKLAKTQANIRQIWVRAETHSPMYSPADLNFGVDAGRDNAFLMVKNVSLYGGFNGNETAITQRNSSRKTTLSGELGAGGNADNAYHVVIFSGDAGTATLNGFTVTGGNADGSAEITVNAKAISRGVAGGIYLNSASPLLTHIDVNGNSTTGAGGGIYNTSSSSPILSNANINNNAAANGGGIYNVDSSSPILTDITINSNTATANGAGIYNAGTSSPKLTNVNVGGNSSGANGGGIYNGNSSAPSLTNVVIRGNKAAADGGGIYNESSSVIVLTNVTLSGNWAVANGGAIYNKNSSPKIYNSILFGNSSGVSNTSSNPTFYSSIIQGSGGSASWLAATGTNGGNNLDVDPRFNSAPNHSTAPFTGGDYNLSIASPAIDAASNGYYVGLSTTTTDLQGRPRVYNYATNGVIDMGAYEYQAAYRTNTDNVIFVKKGTTGSGASWSNSMGELADALKIARTVGGIKEIWVAEGTYYPMYSPDDDNFGNNAGRSNAFLLTRDVKIYGGFAGTETTIKQRDTINGLYPSILSGDLGVVGNNGDNAYHVVVSVGDVGKASLNGFTIAGGNAGGGNEVYLTVQGQLLRSTFCGGIYNQNSSPTLSNLNITGNLAQNGAGGIGNMSNSSPVMKNIFINANSAGSGAGIYINGSPKLTNVVISGNSAVNNGGGVFVNAGSALTLVNVTISGNKASSGGAVYITGLASAAAPKLYNSIIYGNSSGVVNVSTSAKLTFYNSIVQGSGGSSNWIADLGINGGNNLAVDPQFVAAPNHTTAPFTGGDYRLQSTSPAINAGNNSYYTDLDASSSDLAGNLRIFENSYNGVIDLGAYEHHKFIIPNADGVLFVKKASTGEGTNWGNAMGELADALRAAKTNSDIKQIWVARGTYHPLYSPADNNFGKNAGKYNAFLLVKDVKIYGGFEGVETSTKDRDTINWAHKSILSGDIGVAGDNTDNVYHVVISSGDVGNAQLNGFTITGGNANSNGAYPINVNSNEFYAGVGGGIYNVTSSPFLNNLTISDNAVGGGGRGAGVYNISSSSPVFNNVTISGNLANVGGSGGGMYIDSSSPVLTNVTITNNSSAVDGGGIYSSSSSLVLTDVAIRNNAAVNNLGGGIYSANSTLILNNINIDANKSHLGGGIYNSSSSLAFTGGSINGNSATQGGGLFVSNSASLSVELKDITVSGNKAIDAGGGIYTASSLGLTNVNIIGNKSNAVGGAIFNTSSPTFINVTIAGNSAREGGVIYNTGNLPSPKFYNSIIYGNSSFANWGGGSIYRNSVIQGSGGSANWVAATGLDGGHNMDIDPKFIDPISHTTAPFTEGDYKLQPSSPAINKGDNNLYAGLSASTTDLAVNLRVYNFAGGGIIDMGAYEYQGVPILPNADGIVYVKKDGTGNGTSWTNAVGELADALKVAKTNTAIKQIWIAKGTYHPTYSPADDNFGNDGGRDNAFLLVKDVKIYGGFDPANNISTLADHRIFGEKGTILSGDLGIPGDDQDNAYHVLISAGDLGTTLVDGLTIKHGRAENPGGVKITVNGENIYRNSGAGIYNIGATNTLTHVWVSDNYSEGHGAGIYNDGSSANAQPSHLLVSNSVISSNNGDGEGSFTCSGATAVYVNTNFANNNGFAVQDSGNSITDVYNSVFYKNGNSRDCVQSTKVGIVKNSLIVKVQGSKAEFKSFTSEPTNIFYDDSEISYEDLLTMVGTNPVINRGSNTAYTTNGGSLNDVDMAGNPRVYNINGNGTIDIGAYEFQSLVDQTISFAALDAKTTTSADFTLTATASSGLAVSYTSSDANIADVYEDNGIWKVKIKAAGSVVITASQSGNGDYAAATAVDQTLIITEAVLPVTLTSYAAKMVNQTARLDWSVSSERDNRKFVIYRSGDDQQFTEIGTVASLGNTNTNRNYFFVDKQPLNGNTYYKLVQVDLDGKPTELGVKPLNFVLSTVNLKVYPNPTKDKVNVTFEAGKYNRIVLSSVDGKVLKSVALSAQQDQLDIDLTAYPIGTYFIRLTGAQQSVVKKVVKQ